MQRKLCRYVRAVVGAHVVTASTRSANQTIGAPNCNRGSVGSSYCCVTYIYLAIIGILDSK